MFLYDIVQHPLYKLLLFRPSCDYYSYIVVIIAAAAVAAFDVVTSVIGEVVVVD